MEAESLERPLRELREKYEEEESRKEGQPPGGNNQGREGFKARRMGKTGVAKSGDHGGKRVNSPDPAVAAVE